jgi:hypothetical protein
LFYPVKNQLIFTKSLENETIIVIKDKNQVEKKLLQYIKSLKNWFSEIPLEDFLVFLGISEKLNDIDELSINHLDHFFITINNIYQHDTACNCTFETLYLQK